MRSAFYKCPNHLNCTVGYHGDDIEVLSGLPLICEECGSPLQPVRKSPSALIPFLVNTLILGALAVGIWMAWPSALKLWQQFTAPPAETRK